MTSDGPLVAFRNRSEDEIRDIYVARLENGTWTEPSPVHNHGWRIPACPVNGPMLSARGRDVVVAWFTVKDGVGYTFVAFSNDAGKTFGQPIQLDAASAIGRVDVELLMDGSAVATWIDFAGQRSTFSARRVFPSGRRSAHAIVAAVEGARTSGYPRVARHGNELVFAWTGPHDGALRVHTAAAVAATR